jgi:hypothetical protein
MRIHLALIFALTTVQTVAGGTFKGTTNATFTVKESLDGTTTTATKSGLFNVSLNTDYSTMRWSLDFDVNLLMATLVASGNLLSGRCPGGCSTPLSPGDPSPLSFPDATGKSGAGTYRLLGTAAWSLTDRIATVTRTRTSPSKPVIATGSTSGGVGNHYLTVANYPSSITLTPGFSSISSYQESNGDWPLYSGIPLHLGRIDNGGNYLEVTVSSFPGTITLLESPAGDLTSNGVVDGADYVLWRKSPGLLSPFLSSYAVWRANFGNPSSGLGSTLVPEPSGLALLLTVTALVLSRRKARLSCEAYN